jgi:hypothetical protein
VANTLAYYDMATITAIKSFIVQAPGLSNGGLFNETARYNKKLNQGPIL